MVEEEDNEEIKPNQIEPQQKQNAKEEKKEVSIPLKFFYFSIQLDQNLCQSNTTIISSYSNEGGADEFNVLTNLLTNPTDDLLYNIFLSKDIFKKRNSLNNDKIHHQKEIKLKQKEVKQSLSSNQEFAHFFAYKHWEHPDYFNWFFNCFVYYHTYLDITTPKVLIIVSKDAFFNFYRGALNHIHKNPQGENELFRQLSLYPFKVNWLPSLFNNKNSNPFSILSYCDLDYSLLFSLFSFDDLVFLLEHFLRKTCIVLNCHHVDMSYPLYHSLVNLFFPLNSTDDRYTYRLVTPESLKSFHFTPALWIFNDLLIPSSELTTMIKNNSSKLVVITISKSEGTDQKHKAVIQCYYQNQKNEQEMIDNSKHSLPRLIKKVFKQTKQGIELYNSVRLKFANQEKNKKVLMFGFIIKLMMTLFPSVKYKYNGLQLICDYETLKPNCSPKIDDLINEFIALIIEHPSFFLISKLLDIRNGFDLKAFVFIDDIIKLYQIDSTLFYVNEKEIKNWLIYNHITDNKEVAAEIKEGCPLMIEFESYYKMVEDKEITFENNKDILMGVTAFVLSLSILYDLSNSEVKNVERDFKELYLLFQSSTGFHNKFNIVISLIFEIITSDERLSHVYYKSYLHFLTDFNLMVPASIYLKVNYKMQNRPIQRKKRSMRPVIISQEMMQSSDNHQHTIHAEMSELNKCQDCLCPIVIMTKPEVGLYRTDKMVNIIECLLNVIRTIIINQTYLIDDFDTCDFKFLRLYRLMSFYAEKCLKIQLFKE